MSRSLRVQAMLALLNATHIHDQMNSESANAEAMKEIMSDAAITGMGAGLIIIDDFDIAGLAALERTLDAQKIVIIGHPDQLNPRTGRRHTVNEASTRAVEIGNHIHEEAMAFIHGLATEHSVSLKAQKLRIAQVLAYGIDDHIAPVFELPDISWLRGVNLDRPHTDTWSNDQKSRKIPKPSFKQQKNVFRTTMRSVNRNR